MAELASLLSAKVHDGSGLTISRRDRILGRLTFLNPLWWAIARNLSQSISPGDVIFCTGEDVGVPVAFLCGHRASVAMTVHAADSLKKRLAFRLFGLRSKTKKFFAVAQTQVDALRDVHRISPKKIEFIWDQTDTRFFSPGPAPQKKRPLIVSVGLERRDYTTLALATAGMAVDVKISGHSEDTRVIDQAFPETLPTNMSRKFYSWVELRDLYRAADLVVVSLFPNQYAAGVQGVMEALSVGAPLVVTATEGLTPYLEPTYASLVVPCDPYALAGVIDQMLRNPDQGLANAEIGKLVAKDRHTMERYVSTLSKSLRALAN
jgi:glycosyltransferase involved in cell wall biosynthesis